MGEFFFVAKTMLATFLFIALMQIKINDSTLEKKAYQILAESQFTVFLNDVALKAVQLGKDTNIKLQEYFKK